MLISQTISVIDAYSGTPVLTGLAHGMAYRVKEFIDNFNLGSTPDPDDTETDILYLFRNRLCRMLTTNWTQISLTWRPYLPSANSRWSTPLSAWRDAVTTTKSVQNVTIQHR